MNMKNALIVLIFLLSILGLILGVYYSDDIVNSVSDDGNYDRVYSDEDGVLTITLEKEDDIYIDKNGL